MAQKTYGIDFGTGTIKVYRKGQGIVMLERNVVSTVGKEKKPVAIGEKAFEMFEKAPPSITVTFPMKHGVISSMQEMAALWDFLYNKLNKHHKKKGADLFIAVPSDITDVEKQSYTRIVTEGESKPKKITLIDKPVADAYGLGINVEKISGILVVNIGSDTTEVSILSHGGIIVSKLLPYGGNYFDNQIINYIRKEYNFVIGKKTAEQVKKKLVSAFPTDDKMEFIGRDMVKGLPRTLTISSSEIHPKTYDVFETIANAIQSMLEHTPPEISHEIKERGLYLTGGSSWIRGIDRFLADETYIKVNTTDKAQETVIRGLGYLTEHPRLAAKYQRSFGE